MEKKQALLAGTGGIAGFLAAAAAKAAERAQAKDEKKSVEIPLTARSTTKLLRSERGEGKRKLRAWANARAIEIGERVPLKHMHSAARNRELAARQANLLTGSNAAPAKGRAKVKKAA